VSVLEAFQTAGGVGGIVGLTAWLGSLERTSREHDRLIRHEHEDLLTFARDALQEEATALIAVTNELNARNLL
jgi:hypothetical protein